MPLEKIMIFHGVDFRQNKYEFYLDMWDTPRIGRETVLLDGFKNARKLDVGIMSSCPR